MYLRRLFSHKKITLLYSNALNQSMVLAIQQRTKHVQNLEQRHKKAGQSRKVSQQILQKDNSKSLISKEQEKLILMPEQFNKLNKNSYNKKLSINKKFITPICLKTTLDSRIKKLKQLDSHKIIGINKKYTTQKSFNESLYF